MHISHLTPHTSHLTPHTSHLTPHTSHLAPHSLFQDVMHGRHTVQYKGEIVCDSSMQLLPLRVKAVHSSVLAAAACSPSMANPSMVLCRPRCSCLAGIVAHARAIRSMTVPHLQQQQGVWLRASSSCGSSRRSTQLCANGGTHWHSQGRGCVSHCFTLQSRRRFCYLLLISK